MPNNLDYQIPPSGEPVSTEEINIDGILQHLQRVKIGVGVKNAYQEDLSFGETIAASSIPIALSTENYNLTELEYNIIDTGDFTVDVSNYRAISLQLDFSGSTLEASFYGSNDNVFWTPVALLDTKSAWQVTATNISGIYYGPICFKYFKLSAAGGGNLSTLVELGRNTIGLHAQHVRTELGFPADLTNVLPSSINAGQVASMPYSYNNTDNEWKRNPSANTDLSVTSTVNAPVTRVVGKVYVEQNTVTGKNRYMVGESPIYPVWGNAHAVAPTGSAISYIWHPVNNNKIVKLEKASFSYVNDTQPAPTGSIGFGSVHLNRITSFQGDARLEPVNVEFTAASSTIYAFKSTSNSLPSVPSRGEHIGSTIIDGNRIQHDFINPEYPLISGTGGNAGWEIFFDPGASTYGSGNNVVSPVFAVSFVWTEE